MTPTATNPATTHTHRPTRKVCQECDGSGTVWTRTHPVIGRTADGAPVYSRRERLYGKACQCRTGWPKGERR